MSRGLGLIGLAVLLSVSIGCSNSMTSPSAAAISGTWSGSITDSVAGPGSVRVTFAQSGSNLSGTWFSTFYQNPSNNNSGTVNGSVSGSSVSALLTPSVPGTCPFQVTATLDEGGHHMPGTYAATRCSVAVSGGLNLRKE
jgi:hypothetical protein